jgi:hypothetical protein
MTNTNAKLVPSQFFRSGYAIRHPDRMDASRAFRVLGELADDPTAVVVHPVGYPGDVRLMQRSLLQPVGFALPGDRADALNMLGAPVVYHMDAPHGCVLDGVDDASLRTAVDDADKLRFPSERRARIESAIAACASQL